MIKIHESRSGVRLLTAQSTRQGLIFLVVIGLLAKALGFARETAIAHAFGVSREYDIFLAIFMIPTITFSVLTYSISYALIPFYHKLQVNQGEGFASSYMKKLIFAAVAIGVLVTLGMFLGENKLVSMVVVSGTAPEHVFAVRLFRILVWLMPLYFGICILQTVLQAEKYFLALSIGPVIQNVVITLVVLLYGRWGIIDLAIAWSLGILVWFVWLSLIFFMSRNNLDRHGQGSGRPESQLLRMVIVSIIQVILVELWPQLFVVFDRVVAQVNHLPNGTIGALSYATTLYTIVLSIFVLSLGQVLFPTLSAHAAAGREHELNTILSRGFRATVLATLPIAALLFALSTDIVVLVFQRGHFDSVAAITTAGALRLYALGLPMDSVYMVLLSYLYAKRDFKNLIVAGLLSFMAKIFGGMALVYGLGYMGFALSTVLATLTRTGYLVHCISNQGIHLLGRGKNLTMLMKVGGATLLGVIAVFASAPWIGSILGSVTKWAILAGSAKLIACTGLFVLIYATMLNTFHIPEWVQVTDYLKSRMNKGNG